MNKADLVKLPLAERETNVFTFLGQKFVIEPKNTLDENNIDYRIIFYEPPQTLITAIHKQSDKVLGTYAKVKYVEYAGNRKIIVLPQKQSTYSKNAVDTSSAAMRNLMWNETCSLMAKLVEESMQITISKDFYNGHINQNTGELSNVLFGECNVNLWNKFILIYTSTNKIKLNYKADSKVLGYWAKAYNIELDSQGIVAEDIYKQPNIMESVFNKKPLSNPEHVHKDELNIRRIGPIRSAMYFAKGYATDYLVLDDNRILLDIQEPFNFSDTLLKPKTYIATFVESDSNDEFIFKATHEIQPLITIQRGPMIYIYKLDERNTFENMLEAKQYLGVKC